MAVSRFPWPAPHFQTRLPIQPCCSTKSAPPCPVGRRTSNPRPPVTKGRPLSKEAIAAVQAIKADTENVSVLSRLLKKDLLEVLKELQRQDDCTLSLKIFEMIRGEDWYKPDIGLFRRMFELMWRNYKWDKMVYIYEQVKQEGLQVEFFMHRELMMAHLDNEEPLLAMQLYKETTGLGFHFNEKTYRILIRRLRNLEQCEAADLVELEFATAFPLSKRSN